MLSKLRSRLTYANVVASIALFIALGGTSYGLATGSIGSREIKNNSVRSKDIRNNDVRGRDIRNGSLLANDFRAGQLPAGEKGATGAQGPPGIQGPPGEDATRLFAYIRDPAGTSAVVDYGSGVTSVTEPAANDGRYVITFNRDMQRCVVQATAGFGDPPGDGGNLNTSVPIIRMEQGTSTEVQLDWLRPDNDVDFGVPIDTSFLISAFC